jgi:hypothetical protein
MFNWAVDILRTHGFEVKRHAYPRAEVAVKHGDGESVLVLASATYPLRGKSDDDTSTTPALPGDGSNS